LRQGLLHDHDLKEPSAGTDRYSSSGTRVKIIANRLPTEVTKSGIANLVFSPGILNGFWTNSGSSPFPAPLDSVRQFYPEYRDKVCDGDRSDQRAGAGNEMEVRRRSSRHCLSETCTSTEFTSE